MEQSHEIRNLIGIIRRQYLIIAAVAIVLMVAVSLVLFTLVPKYTATAKLLVDPSSKNLLNPTDRPDYSGIETNARVDSEVAILNTGNAIAQLIKDQNLMSDPEFGVTLGWFDKVLTVFNLESPAATDSDELVAKVVKRVEKAVDVEREGMTYVISVSFTSRDPQKSVALANALAQTYIDQQLQSKVSGTLASRNIIQAQLGQANDAVVRGERKLDEYMEQNLAKLQELSGSDEIKRLREEMDATLRRNVDRNNALAAAQKQLTEGNYSALADTLKSDALKALQVQRANLASSMSIPVIGGKPQGNIQKDLAALDKKLQDSAAAAVVAFQKDVAAGGNTTDTLRERLRTAIMSSNLPPEVLAEVYAIQKESEIAREQYQSLLSRMKELDTQAQLQVPDSRIVSVALLPTTPSFPKVGRSLGIALGASLLLGLGVAFMRENFIGGFIEDEQIESVLRVPVAAVIEKQATPANARHGIPDLIISTPMSAFAEAFRRIRVKIERMNIDRNRNGDFSMNGQPGGLVVLVTSSVPNEGKSTVSLSLARTLAHSGRRTLLIDADLRKPSVHKLVGLNQSNQLANYLQGQNGEGLSSMITADPSGNLKLALGGRLSNHATDELVMGDRFAALIAEARQQFDFIVIDTPPIDPVVDGLYIARHADFVTFVVRWSTTAQTVAKRCMKALQENCAPGTTMLGVMSQREVAKGSRYYRYSGYYES